MSEIIKHAIISSDEKYRYLSVRQWDANLPKLGWVMLNPSTADAENDDPTIRRCIGFAKDWGYGAIIVGNLFAFRATNPKELLKASSPSGDDNEFHLQSIFDSCEKVVCAWGAFAPKVYEYDYMASKVREFGRRYALGYTKQCEPIHPLYVSKNKTLFEMFI